MTIDDIMRAIAESGAVWKLERGERTLERGENINVALIRESNTGHCPLGVICDLPNRTLGLMDLSEAIDIRPIMYAADGHPYASPELRDRLLAACGLSEEKQNEEKGA